MNSRVKKKGPNGDGEWNNDVSNDDEALVLSSEDHTIPSKGHVIPGDDHFHGKAAESEDDNDTAGECLDMPMDSVTTDGFTDHMDPIDFIETHPRDFGHGRQQHLNGPHLQGYGRSLGIGGGGVVQDVQNERWGMVLQMEDSNKKGKVAKRFKPPRVMKSERMRTPYQVPRPNKPGKLLHGHPRPSPLSRKRRLSVRLARPAQVSSVSEEGDMAQADEMGEGEGRDDGFVEGLDPVGRRRNKKRSGAIHSFLPAMGGASPPSSPSNEPRSRRRASSRKSRPKPRSRKQGKPQLASADMSTQDSATQGPGSSDTSNVTSPEDGGTPLRAGDVAINSDEEEEEDEYDYGDEGRSVTPNIKTGTVGASGKAQDAHNGMNGNAPPVADVKLAEPPVGHANFEKATPTIQSKTESLYGNDVPVDMLDSHYHRGYFSVNSPVSHKDTRQWAVRRQESDLSTAPFSSETSDMDTSGNERIATTDSMVDVNSDVHVAPSPPINRAQGDRKGVPLGKVKGVGMVSRKEHSGSSGDDASAWRRNSKKLASGKSIPSKPLPPASAAVKRPSLKSKSAALMSQSNRLASDSPFIPARKPLPHQRSTPLLPSKMVTRRSPPASSQSSSKTKGLMESHSTSSLLAGAHTSSTTGSRTAAAKSAAKPAVSSRPKPPVNPKPSKPAVAPPKPAVKAGPSQSARIASSSAKADSVKPPAKPPASHRLFKIGSDVEEDKESSKKGNEAYPPEQSAAAVASRTRGMRKAYSVEHHVGSVNPPMPKVVPRSKPKESLEKEDKRAKGIQSPSPPPVPLNKPSLPSKPRRLSERRASKPQASGHPEAGVPSTDTKGTGTVPPTTGALAASGTSTSSLVASALQSSSMKSLSSSDGATSGHSQSPVASPSAMTKKSFNIGVKSDKVSSSSAALHKAIPSSTIYNRAVHSSAASHKGGSGSVTSHRTGPGSVTCHKTGPSSVISRKTGPGSVTSHKSGLGSVNKTGPSHRTSPSSTLQKTSTTASNPSLSGSRDSKRNEKSSALNITKEVKVKGRDAVERPRIAALMEKRNERQAKVERKKNVSTVSKARDIDETRAEAGDQALTIGKTNSTCSLDVDSTPHSVSEVSLTDSPSPSPFHSASDLSADQSNKRHDKSEPESRLQDFSSSEEATPPPPIPPREYLKSPEDLLALNLQPIMDPSVTAASRPLSAVVPQRKLSRGPRRPPPNPPKDAPITDAAPTCNVSTNIAERSGSAYADHPAAKLIDLRATRDNNRKNVTSHYEVVDELAQLPRGNGKYFEKHALRDSVEPVNYSLVKRGQSQDNANSERGTQVGGASQSSLCPPLPPVHRPVLKRATTVGGDHSCISVHVENDSEGTTKGGKINFLESRTSVGRRPPPRPPKPYAASSSSSSSSSNSVAPSTADQEDGDIYTVIDEGDKAALMRRAISQPVISQPVIPVKQPLSQRMSLILGTTSEDEPPPLPSRPAPKLKSPISPEPVPRNQASKQPHSVPPGPYKGLVLAKDGPPVLIQLPKHRDPIYDVIPEHVKAVRNSKNKKREYEEIVLPELDGEKPRLWIPPEREKKQLQEQEEQMKQQEQLLKQQQQQQQQQQKLQKQQEQQVEQQGDDWSSSSGKSSPFLSKRNSTSSNGSAGPIGSTPLISVILPDKAVSRLAANMSKKNLDIGDLRENWKDDGLPVVVGSPPAIRRKQAMSFSGRQNLKLKARTASCRRSYSERFNKVKASTMDSSTTKKAFRRSSSLDHLDDRMDKSVRNSVHLKKDGSSSEEEEEPSIPPSTSPRGSTNTLPRLPSNDSPYRVPRSHNKPAGPYLVPPDVEPLYQYINTAEFLRETEEGGVKLGECEDRGRGQSQLALARQLLMRRLWCEQPDVINSGILKLLTDEERKLQEAMFEVISSEDTYLRSLDVLIQHFMDDPGMNPYLPEGRRVMDKRQHHVIFSNVKEVREVSAQFLSELQGRQRNSAVVKNISDIILEFAEYKFDCYIRYCTNQVYQIREMQDIIEGNLMFREYLRRLESDKICQNLSIQSFLLLPMQRITRLPLLILAILNRTPLDHPDHDVVENTLRSVQMLVTACNDGARQMDRTEQLHEIHKKLDFGKLRPFPIVSASRQLERRGILVRLQVEQKLLGKNKIKKKPYYLFVFTDYIIITKKKKDARGEDYFRVKDYASRAVVEVEWLNAYTGVTFPKFGEQDPIARATAAVSTANARHGFLLLFLDNASGRKEDYILLAQNDTDRTRWIEAIRPVDPDNDQETIYQLWDCPQVQAVYDYHAQQPDELDLQRGDVVKVYRKMADGWYEGERLRDSQCGWFPSNFTEEIENAHTKARNLRHTHKLNSSTANARLVMQMKS